MCDNIDFTKKIYCVITGASRGIGRTIAVEIARKAVNGITLFLLARSEPELIKTEEDILSVNSKAVVTFQSLDLSKVETTHLVTILKHSWNESPNTELAIIFHNAGHIGKLAPTIELQESKLWRDYYELNMVSTASLNSVFLEIVRKNNAARVAIVNITSLCGRKPFKYLSMYSSVKAARDMYFKVLAEEEPNIIILNYSPGMVDTSMANELLAYLASVENKQLDGTSSLLTPEQTVHKLMGLLESGKFKSGDIVDYYD